MDRARQGNRDSERQTSCASSHVTVLASDCKYMDLGGSKQGQRSKVKGRGTGGYKRGGFKGGGGEDDRAKRKREQRSKCVRVGGETGEEGRAEQ